MLNLTTDIKTPRLASKFCSFGLTEIVAPLIVGALTSAGVGATTAGAIGAIAAPALIGAGGGALVGAGGELLKGGKPFKGALTGAGIGGALGAGYGAPGALGAAFPETMASLGLGPQMAAAGAGGTWTPGAGGFPASAGVAPAADTLSAVTGLDPATISDLYGDASVPGGAPAGALAANAAQGSSGLGGTLKNLLQLGALGQAFSKPAAPNYGILPGPGSTAATQGPYFNAPLMTNGYLNRSANQNYVPNGGDWYKFGNSAQPNFFNNNQIRYPIRMADGGALSRRGQPFKPFEDGGHVSGEGDGLSDSVPAMLSDGEYVLTAADVSRLGGGSTDAGVKRLDAMRENLASHVGAKKFQKRPKSPLQYATPKRRAA